MATFSYADTKAAQFPEARPDEDHVKAEPDHDVREYLARPMCEDGDVSEKLKCMVGKVKTRLLQVGDAEPNMNSIPTEERQKVLDKAREVSKGMDYYSEKHFQEEQALARLREASNASASDHGKPGLEELESSLGKAKFTFSRPLYNGPISPDYRFPHGAVQPGLLMHALDLVDLDPMAICNDGSSGIMYLNEGTLGNKFHLHIDGGYFCWDEESCFKRARGAPFLASTKGWERTTNGSGIFDPVNGGFPGWFHSRLGYCSSDAWFGQIDVDDFQMIGGTMINGNTPGTHFRGYTQLQAALKILLQHGLGKEAGHELLVSGCSAGSVATTAQADSFLPRLKKLAKQMKIKFVEPKVSLLLDNAPIVSPPGYLNVSIEDQIGMAAGFLYGAGRGVSPNEFLNQDCVKALDAGTGWSTGGAAGCLWTATVMPHIKTPNLVLNMLWENFVTGNFYYFFEATLPSHYAIGVHEVKETRKVLERVTPQQNFWSIGCNGHCITDTPHWWRLAPPSAPGDGWKTSCKDMMLKTMERDTGHIVGDTCNDYNCGCIGQNFAYTLLAINVAEKALLYRLTGWAFATPLPLSIGRMNGFMP
jgi:hypothetical protein